jgi:hypothetical protein
VAREHALHLTFTYPGGDVCNYRKDGMFSTAAKRSGLAVENHLPVSQSERLKRFRFLQGSHRSDASIRAPVLRQDPARLLHLFGTTVEQLRREQPLEALTQSISISISPGGQLLNQIIIRLIQFRVWLNVYVYLSLRRVFPGFCFHVLCRPPCGVAPDSAQYYSS